MTDLHIDYLGLRLRSPLVASAGPYTGDLDRMAELEQAGAGGDRVAVAVRGADRARDQRDRPVVLAPPGQLRRGDVVPARDRRLQHRHRHVPVVGRGRQGPGRRAGHRQPQRHQRRWLAALRQAARGRRRRCDRAQPLHGGRRSDGRWPVDRGRAARAGGGRRRRGRRCRWPSRSRRSTRRWRRSSSRCRMPAPRAS